MLGGFMRGPVSTSRTELGQWLVTNVAANLTNNGNIAFDQGQNQRFWMARRAGRATGISLFLNSLNGSPVGTVTLTVFKNASDPGATYDLACTPSTSADQGAHTIFATPLSFVAGDYLELRITTTADWNSTSADLSASVEIEY